MKKNKKSINNLVMEYFIKHPNIPLKHAPVVDWVEMHYLKLYKRKPRDTWRAIRKLYENGFLIQVDKGVYKYDPDYTKNPELEDFTEIQKKEIMRNHKYRCAECGRGIKDGYELHIDHILPKSKGGKAEVWNGQVLCSIHNIRKKNYGQTQTGKKMFINFYNIAKEINDKKMKNFMRELLEVFEKYNINGHIEWKK